MTKSQNDLLLIGEIIGLHGLNGELKVRPFTNNPENFYEFDEVIVKGKTLPIRGIQVHKKIIYLLLERVTKRTTAEKILHEKIYVPKEYADPLEEDEFYIADLLGALVVDSNGEKIGTLSDVKQSGPVDNFEIQLEEKTILVPALKEYFTIESVNKIIAEIPEEFFEL